MSMQITNARITSTLTNETATCRPAATPDAEDTWSVSWLPDRAFNRDAAVTAITLAETLAGGVTPGHARWPEAEAWARELALTPTVALALYRRGARSADGPLDPTPDQHAAVQRLIDVAAGTDGGALSVANFLLAWRDAPAYGGFDFRHLWSLDPQAEADLRTVFGLILDTCADPAALGYAADMQRLAALWRPQGTPPPEALAPLPYRPAPSTETSRGA